MIGRPMSAAGRFVVGIACLSGWPGVGFAQTPAPIEIGETVRVWEPTSVAGVARAGPSGFYRGMVGDTIRFVGEAPINEWRFPIDSIYRLEVQRGYDRSQFLGTIVGVAAGIAVDLLLVQGDNDESAGALVAIPIATGALGWVIGYHIRSPRWVDYPVEALSAASSGGRP